MHSGSLSDLLAGEDAFQDIAKGREEIKITKEQRTVASVVAERGLVRSLTFVQLFRESCDLRIKFM